MTTDKPGKTKRAMRLGKCATPTTPRVRPAGRAGPAGPARPDQSLRDRSEAAAPPDFDRAAFASAPAAAAAAADRLSFGDASLHDLFEQQARTMLESADIDEEQKQSILVAMSCPCCGAGGMSFSVKLRSPDGAPPANEGASRTARSVLRASRPDASTLPTEHGAIRGRAPRKR